MRLPYEIRCRRSSRLSMQSSHTRPANHGNVNQGAVAEFHTHEEGESVSRRSMVREFSEVRILARSNRLREVSSQKVLTYQLLPSYARNGRKRRSAIRRNRRVQTGERNLQDRRGFPVLYFAHPRKVSGIHQPSQRISKIREGRTTYFPRKDRNRRSGNVGNKGNPQVVLSHRTALNDGAWSIT